MTHELSGKNILVTGSHGFLGRHVFEHLQKIGANPHSCLKIWDLRNPGVLPFAFRSQKYDVVIHLAGFNGGIQFNKDRPADIFHDNTIMGLNVIHACAEYSIKKLVSVVASCAYPEAEYSKHPNGFHSQGQRSVMREDDFLDGPPHESVACHAYAKRNLQLASKFYHDQYGLNAVCVCPTTLFGPGDSVDPRRTKVLMAIVKKVVDAKKSKAESVTFWGSGNAFREFLYVQDAAKLIALAAVHYNDSDTPLNLGTGQEFRIRELVAKVVDAVGYTGNVEWDTSKPDGQMRKRLDLSRMEATIPSFQITGFDTALRETIDWYTHHGVH